MANPFNVSSGEFGYILKRQAFLSSQDVLSKCVFAIVQQAFPASSPNDEIFVHLDLRLQESVLQRWDGALSVSSSLHVLSQLLPSITASVAENSIGSAFSLLLIKLQEQLQQGFHGITSFSSVILLNDSSLFAQSRQDMVFVRGILATLLPLDASLSASIQAAIDNLDSCLRLSENPFELCSAAATSLSCIVFIRALVSLCEAAERNRTSIEVRRNPARSLLWAWTAIAEQGENPFPPEQFKFLHDSVVEIGCCYDEFVTARMLDAAGIISLFLGALRASDAAIASMKIRSNFLDCVAQHSNSGDCSRTSLVLQATSLAISSCPFYISSISLESSLGDTVASALNHSKTGYVSLPWHPEWQCINKLKGNIKLLMQIDLCSKVLKLVPSFYNKTAREVQEYLSKSHATAVVRNVSFALDQVNDGCTGIMGMLTSCGHALAKILSPDSDVFVDGGTVVSFDSSSDYGVFPLLVHVVLVRLQGGYNGQSCACVKNYSSIFDQASSPSIHTILTDYISGKVFVLDSVSSTSSGESSLHVTDTVVHLADLASRLCQSNYLAPMQIPSIASPCVLDKIPPSSLRRHELCVSNWDSDIHFPFETSGSISPSELDKNDIIVNDEEVDAVVDFFNFSSTLSNSGNNFRFFLFYGEPGAGKTFQSIQVVKRIYLSRKNRGLRFHWHLIDCKAPESARSSFIQAARSDVNIQNKFDVRASPHDVAGALSKHLEGIQ